MRHAPERVVQADVAAIASRLAQAFPASNRGRGARVVSHFDRRMEEGGTNALALLGLVLLVVLVTCVNVANLLLARGGARTRELAVRAALGASRRRLVRGLLIETTVLGIAGAVAGLTVALWLIRLIPWLVVAPPGFRSFTVFEADGRVLAFTLAVTLVTTVLFGVAPSWLSARADVASLIKSGGPASGNRRPGGSVGRMLAVAQVAVSLVLLAGAGALARLFAHVRRADIGLAAPEVLTAWGEGGNGPASGVAESQRSARSSGRAPRRHERRRRPSRAAEPVGRRSASAVFLPDRPAAPMRRRR